MMTQLEYCLQVIENAKARGNRSCQVPIWAEPETIAALTKMEFKVQQIGFDKMDPSHYLKLNFSL
jgi:hypothetical protein